MKVISYFLPAKNLSFFFIFFAGIFFVSCGLDEIVTINNPVITNHKPLYSGVDYQSWYFDFFVRNVGQPDSFLGTDVFYKIYSSSLVLENERAAILSLNESDNTNASAVRMLDYNYKQLGTFPAKTDDTVLFSNTGSDYEVKFRLKTYKGSESYIGENKEQFIACFKIGSNYQSYIPFRNGNVRSFDFFDDNNDDDKHNRDIVPSKGDVDYSGDDSNMDTYYVQMFAVSVGLDETSLGNLYSKVLDLGSVPIKKNQ